MCLFTYENYPSKQPLYLRVQNEPASCGTSLASCTATSKHHRLSHHVEIGVLCHYDCIVATKLKQGFTESLLNFDSHLLSLNKNVLI